MYNTKLKESFNEIKNILSNFNNNIVSELNTKKIKLEYLLKSLDNPNIELYDLEYDKIIESKTIVKDNILIMRWNNQDFKIKIL